MKPLNLFPAIAVVHHPVRGADHSLVIGVPMKNEGHEWCGILLQAPRDTPTQDEAIERIKKGIGIVSGSRSKDSSLSGVIGPERFTAGGLSLENIIERFPDVFLFGCDSADHFDVFTTE